MRRFSNFVSSVSVVIPENPPKQVTRPWKYAGPLPKTEMWCKIYSYQTAVDKVYAIDKEELYTSEWIHFVPKQNT